MPLRLLPVWLWLLPGAVFVTSVAVSVCFYYFYAVLDTSVWMRLLQVRLWLLPVHLRILPKRLRLLLCGFGSLLCFQFLPCGLGYLCVFIDTSGVVAATSGMIVVTSGAVFVTSVRLRSVSITSMQFLIPPCG